MTIDLEQLHATANGNGHAANGHHAQQAQPLHDGYATRAIHVGSEPDPTTGAVVPGLSVATTFLQDGVDKHRGYDYSRSSNPTRNTLESLLTSLETCPVSRTSESHHDDRSGGETLVFASGSAGTAALASWVSLTSDEGGAGGKDGVSGGGGHVLAVNDVVSSALCPERASIQTDSQYGGTARFLSRAARSTGLEVTYLDFEKAGEEGIRAAIRPDTRVSSGHQTRWHR
jgi:cystathionine gamma-lyase